MTGLGWAGFTYDWAGLGYTTVVLEVSNKIPLLTSPRMCGCNRKALNPLKTRVTLQLHLYRKLVQPTAPGKSFIFPAIRIFE